MTTAPSPAATRPATVTLRGPILRSLTSSTASHHLPLFPLFQAGLVPPLPHQRTRAERLLKEPASMMTHSPSSAAASVRLPRQVVPSMTMSSLAAHARSGKYAMKLQRRQLTRMHSLTRQTYWTTWQRTQVAASVVSMTALTPPITKSWQPADQRDSTTSSYQMG